MIIFRNPARYAVKPPVASHHIAKHAVTPQSYRRHLSLLNALFCLAIPASCSAQTVVTKTASSSAITLPGGGLSLGNSSRFYEAKPSPQLDLTDAVTVEAWVQADKMSNDGGRILDKGVPFTLDGYSLDTYPGNSLRFSTQGGSVSYEANLPANQWTQVVGVYSASQRILKLYVNGKEVASKTDGTFLPMTLTKTPLRVGADINGENRFKGRIGRASIYNRALTSNEIEQIYSASQKPEGLVAQWEFASNSGDTLNPVVGTVALQRSQEPRVLMSPISQNALPMQTGKFQPTWESLQQYQVPDWFRNAKFGIWAHWGPQCEPEDGDWYARGMYDEGSGQYRYHRQKYGPQSQFGFKDVIHEWKAENWNPNELMSLYKRAGAQYFFALANHHDNFDLWDSKYQPWNAVNMGPQKDLIGGWEKAARANGMKFGVSIHAAHAWTWYETAQRADKNGLYKGVSYDGKLTKADGVGKWWQGYDPQDLYAQNHPLSRGSENTGTIHSQWGWSNGASIPDVAYCDKFYNRTVDLINRYHPDLVYFDDTVLPLYPISDAGLKIAAHLYNSNMKSHGGKLEAVLFGKILNEDQRKAMVWDIERGQSNTIEPFPWQTDTCIGDWHYNRSRFNNHSYKSAKTVIQTLADVVSKNGNLLLSIPVRGDGTIDSDERAVVEGIADWMQINKEAIFDTRPWKVFGEGPAAASAAPLSAQGFNEGKGKPFTAEDVRFTQKGNVLYAIVLGKPTGTVNITSLGKAAGLQDKSIKKIQLLGSKQKLNWQQNADALVIDSVGDAPSVVANTFKITF